MSKSTDIVIVGRVQRVLNVLILPAIRNADAEHSQKILGIFRSSPIQYGFLDALATEPRAVNGPTNTVDVYYETLCPDSMKFVMYQLEPTHLALMGINPDLVEFNMYPYGKANTTVGSDRSITFSCQHGPEECRRNMHHACYLKELENAGHAGRAPSAIACLFGEMGIDPSADVDEATRKVRQVYEK